MAHSFPTRRSSDLQDFLAVFPAGNSGQFGYFSVSNPSIAKNCLTVGASEVPDENNPLFNKNYIAFFSGIGPTFDNRCVAVDALSSELRDRKSTRLNSSQ